MANRIGVSFCIAPFAIIFIIACANDRESALVTPPQQSSSSTSSLPSATSPAITATVLTYTAIPSARPQILNQGLESIKVKGNSVFSLQVQAKASDPNGYIASYELKIEGLMTAPLLSTTGKVIWAVPPLPSQPILNSTTSNINTNTGYNTGINTGYNTGYNSGYGTNNGYSSGTNNSVMSTTNLPAAVTNTSSTISNQQRVYTGYIKITDNYGLSATAPIGIEYIDVASTTSTNSNAVNSAANNACSILVAGSTTNGIIDSSKRDACAALGVNAGTMNSTFQK